MALIFKSCVALILEEALAFDNLFKEHKIAITLSVSFFVIASLIHRGRNATEVAMNEEIKQEFDKDDDDGVELECVVCLCHVTRGEKYRILTECKHGFHDECINGWLKNHSTCPLCRTQVTHIPPVSQEEDDQLVVIGVLVSYVGCFWENLGQWIMNPLTADFMSSLCQDCNYL